MLSNIQRQIAPDEDWTPPQTKAKFEQWLADRQAQIIGSELAVSVVQRSYKDKRTNQTRTTFNKNYYHQINEAPNASNLDESF